MAYVVNGDEFKSVGNHCITLYVNGNNGSASYDAIYFESFGVQHIPKQSKKFIRNKNITNIYKVEAYYSIMCEYFCIGFIDFMVKSKILLDYTFFFS